MKCKICGVTGKSYYLSICKSCRLKSKIVETTRRKGQPTKSKKHVSLATTPIEPVSPVRVILLWFLAGMVLGAVILGTST